MVCTVAAVWLLCVLFDLPYGLINNMVACGHTTVEGVAMLCVHRTGDLQVWGTCLGHQLQMILTANVDFNDLLITTDAVVSL